MIGLAFTTTGTTIILVYLGNKVGLWETWPVVTAIFWSVTSGMAIIMEIGRGLRGYTPLMQRIQKLLSLPIILYLLVNFPILPWFLEVILVPVLFLFAGAATMGMTRIEWNSAARFSQFLLTMYATAMITLAIKGIVSESSNWNLLVQAFAFPIFLTLTTGAYLTIVVGIEKRRFIFKASKKSINRREYGTKWPLTVDSAVLYKKDSAVWIEVGKIKYALNGRAKTILPYYGHSISDLHDIQADNPNYPIQKIGVYQLIQDGLALDDSPIDPAHL